MWYEVSGDGPPVVLLHCGLADSRQWDPQFVHWADGFRVVRSDFPGYGRTPAADGQVSLVELVVDLLDATQIERATIVGNSLGGRAALEFASERPERVNALVLVAPGLSDHEWSEEVRRFGAEEDELLERGDLERAARLNVDMWSSAAPPDVRERLYEMQLRAFRNQHGTTARLRRVDEKLEKITVPTLVVIGERDVSDMHVIAERLARELPDAELARLEGASHVPNLEDPEQFDSVVLPFLERYASA
jgi:pimeloyl-ACP methyl ester carboxylesterase